MIVCSGKIYKYKGELIEYLRWCYGWWPIKLSGDPYKRLTNKRREIMIAWKDEEDKEKYRYL